MGMENKVTKNLLICKKEKPRILKMNKLCIQIKKLHYNNNNNNKNKTRNHPKVLYLLAVNLN
jgi:hypothetical protein